MKLCILFAAAALTLTGCNIAQRATNYAQKHCVGIALYDENANTTTVHYQCDSLWKFEAAKKNKVLSAKLCIEAVSGGLSGTVIYNGKIK